MRFGFVYILHLELVEVWVVKFAVIRVDTNVVVLVVALHEFLAVGVPGNVVDEFSLDGVDLLEIDVVHLRLLLIYRQVAHRNRMLRKQVGGIRLPGFAALLL